jgi:hypothetical protein
MEPGTDARARLPGPQPTGTPLPERVRELAAVADRIELGLDELFVGCFARGSNFDRTDLEAMLLGLTALSPGDHDLIALTINEMAAERSSDLRVRYSDEG